MLFRTKAAASTPAERLVRLAAALMHARHGARASRRFLKESQRAIETASIAGPSRRAGEQADNFVPGAVELGLFGFRRILDMLAQRSSAADLRSQIGEDIDRKIAHMRVCYESLTEIDGFLTAFEETSRPNTRGGGTAIDFLFMIREALRRSDENSSWRECKTGFDRSQLMSKLNEKDRRLFSEFYNVFCDRFIEISQKFGDLARFCDACAENLFVGGSEKSDEHDAARQLKVLIYRYAALDAEFRKFADYFIHRMSQASNT